jgi:hypothetical protein
VENSRPFGLRRFYEAQKRRTEWHLIRLQMLLPKLESTVETGGAVQAVR